MCAVGDGITWMRVCEFCVWLTHYPSNFISLQNGFRLSIVVNDVYFRNFCNCCSFYSPIHRIIISLSDFLLLGHKRTLCSITLNWFDTFSLRYFKLIKNLIMWEFQKIIFAIEKLQKAKFYSFIENLLININILSVSLFLLKIPYIHYINIIIKSICVCSWDKYAF